jgi:YHS domain-containing protein
MKHTRLSLFFLLLGLAWPAFSADPPAKPTSKEALQAFNDLIGSWRGTGLPENKADKQKGAWSETIRWEWQLPKDDIHLKVLFEKGKYFTEGQLRYLGDGDRYQLTLRTVEKQTLRFEGALKERTLTLDHEDKEKKETQRLIFRLLHDNRYVYQYEVKADGKATFTRVYQVGATKEGTTFAKTGETGPECIVSGGKGTIKVTYKGETYYVCCSGCKDAFLEEPEKFIKEFKEKQRAKKE